MKGILTVVAIFFFQLGIAQQDTSVVDKNKSKITQLNKRLDALLEQPDVAKTNDSLKQKVDAILRNMETMQTEMRVLKTELEQLKSFKSGMHNNSNSGKIDENNYYVILQAWKNESRAKVDLDRWREKEKVQLIRNKTGSWYYIILEDSFTITNAELKVIEMKQKGVTDAWWTTGRKLMLAN